MKRSRIFVSALAVLMVLSATTAEASSDVSRARAATARFKELATAQAAGYGGPLADLKGITCIANPGVGVMGIHYVNGALVGDAILDVTKPEVLVYQMRRDGELRLVAAEYIVFQGTWLAAGHTTPPTLFGRELALVRAGNRYGLPPFYEIHAWIWMHNPAGMFNDWNPRGTCANPAEDEEN